MKFTVFLSLIIILQTTHAHKHKQSLENKPHHTTVSKVKYIDQSSSRDRKVTFPPGSIFPCPMPEDISPCRCSHPGTSEWLTLDCSNADSDLSLQKVFDAYFPSKYYSKFTMEENDNIRQLNRAHDIRFKLIDVYIGNSLQSISLEFMKASIYHLEEVYIERARLLTDFPLGQLQPFAVLERLTIFYAGLETIDPIVSRKLNYINFKENYISSIDRETFKNVPKLRTLDMSYNSIKSLNSHTIPIRSGMDKVAFTFNSFSHIEPGAFYDGSKDLASAGLKELDLSNCELTSLGERTVPLTQLTEVIKLNNNKISSISPGAFFILSEPVSDGFTIDLSNNSLIAIDIADTFKNVPNLPSLDLGDNSFSRLDTHTIPIRSGMGTLSFSGNPISHIEPGAFYDGSKDFHSAGLKELDLSNCELTSLGERTVPLTQLTERIDLSDNQISSISPGAFFILSEPVSDGVYIYLSNNQFTTIDVADTFRNVLNLRSLYLDGNSISRLNTHTFPIRSGMEIVSFRGNPIRHIEPGAFYDGSKDLASAGLKMLDLSNSYYHTTLGERAVPLTQTGGVIFLNNNNIRTISPGAFFIVSEPKPDSVTITLDFNYLQTLDEGAFGGSMEYISKIYLYVNYIYCGCNVAWIVRDPYFMGKIGTTTTCVDRTYFYDLQPEDFEHCPQLTTLGTAETSLE